MKSNPHNNQLVRVRLDEVDDSGKQQLVKTRGRKREQLGGDKVKVHRIGHYGVAYHPPKGSQGHAQIMGGNPDQAQVTDLEHPDYRPTGLQEGEVKLYDKISQYVFLKADGSVVIHGGGSATITMKNGNIILEPGLGGLIKLGGADATREVAAIGSLDNDSEANGADALVSNLLTKVVGK